MIEKLKALFSQKQPRGIPVFLIIGLAGMLLIGLSEWIPAKTPTEPTSDMDTAEYTKNLEARLCRLLEQVEGAGETSVMITLESGEETIYACNTKTGENAREQEHILLEGGNENALVERVVPPRVQGAAVVCSGADDIRVTARITEIASVLLGISTNRISVAKMSS